MYYDTSIVRVTPLNLFILVSLTGFLFSLREILKALRPHSLTFVPGDPKCPFDFLVQVGAYGE